MKNFTLRGAPIVPLYYKSWIVKGPRYTVWAKTNRHSGEVKDGTGGLEDIEEATDDLLQVLISSPCLFSLACFILWLAIAVVHSPSNGYLPCWKGLLFLTREREIDKKEAGKLRSKRDGREAQTGAKNRKYHWRWSPWWQRLSPSQL